MNKIFPLIIIFALSFAMQAFSQRVVRVGAFNFYPAIFQDKDLTIKGFYVDALSEIGKKENIVFEYVYGSWSQGLERLQNEEIDIMPSVAYFPERAQVMHFAEVPLLTVWGELYTHSETNIHGILDIKNHRIAIMKSDANALNFIEKIKDFGMQCNYVEMNSFDEIFSAIKSKKVDAGVVNNTYGAAKNSEYKVIPTGIVFNPFDIYFASKKNKNEDIIQLLDKYLLKWKNQKESVYNLSRNKWSHGTVGQIEVFPQWLETFLWGIAAAIILALAFIILLKIQVGKATAKILKSEEKFRIYFNNSIDGIFVANAAGNYVEVNPAACTATGYTKEELLTMNIHKLHSEETLETIKLHFDNLKLHGKISFETIYKTKLGERRWWSLQALKLSEEAYIGFAKDITERKISEIALLKKTIEIEKQNSELIIAKLKAEESDRLKTAFLQNLSHEIRTPLNAIMGFSSLLSNMSGDTKKKKEFAKIINDKGDDLVQIVNEVLEIAKIVSNQLIACYGKLSVCSLLAYSEKVFEKLQLKEPKPLVRFNNVVSDELSVFEIYTDSSKLQRIIYNLLNNAYKFTDSGTIELHCSVENNTQIKFKITDTGIGIPKDKQNEIFKSFVKLESDAKQHIGSGLGLSIVDGYLRFLSGTLTLESEPDKGSSFEFSIPVGDIENQNSIYPESFMQQQNSYNAEKSQKTVLVVEDDLANHKFLEEVVLSQNYNCLHAFSGSEAVAVALSHSDLDLVLMDIQLPGPQWF
ncbi:MAG: PAS domain S-box protein [Bacteroidales bacterium]|nr:PAS domain S-box protein [Bacteroidales bacterium]